MLSVNSGEHKYPEVEAIGIHDMTKDNRTQTTLYIS